jgi:hypothetical protein
VQDGQFQDLFAEVNFGHFPPDVNEPTLACLNQCLQSINLPEMERLTVRELVRRMLNIFVPPECQCWNVVSSMSMADVSHLSDEQRRDKRLLELQWVIASCSRGVFASVQEAWKKYKAQGKVTETYKFVSLKRTTLTVYIG